jgi:hypothetical protein
VVGDVLDLSEVMPINGELDLKTGHRRLVYLFTTTCPSCLINQSPWRDLAEILDGTDLSVIGVSLDNRQWTIEYPDSVMYPVYVVGDPASFMVHNKIQSVPQTILCSRNQEVEQIWIGSISSEHMAEILRTVSAE